jgi:hypothetical protein
MSMNNPTWGEGYVPAYQLSASPFVTSSNVTLGAIKEIPFQGVTRFFTVKNTGASSSVLAVSFTQNGFLARNSNYLILSGAEAYSGEIRVDRLFVSGVAGSSTFTVVAGLTPISTGSFLRVTSSNGFPGVG